MTKIGVLKPVPQPCIHNFVYIDTIRNKKDSGAMITYTRIDNFYCSKCCNMIEKQKSKLSYDLPDWF